MLRPAKMVKVAIVGIRKNSHTILSVLHDLGAVQVEPLSGEALRLVKKEVGGQLLREVSEELLRIRSLKSALPPSPVSVRKRFSSLKELLDASRSINIDEEVKELRGRIDEYESKLENIRSLSTLVGKLSFLEFDLANLDLKSASSFVGEMDEEAFAQFLDELKTSVGTYLESHTTTNRKVVVLLVVPTDKLSAFGSTIQKMNLRFERVPQLSGTPKRVLEDLERRQAELKAEVERLLVRLRELSAKHYTDIVCVEEQLAIESRKLEVLESLGFTDSLIVIEGWVPAHRLNQLRLALDRNTDNTTLVFTSEVENEEPPTLMENPKPFKPFEAFVRFYSLPQAEEVDPTIVYSLVFPVFFGLMLGDVGYGVLILLLALWIKRYTEHGGHTIVPKSLRSFARTFFRPSGWAKLSRALIPASVVAIFFGFLFNEYFGFHFNQYLYHALGCRGASGVCATGAVLDPTTSLGLKKLLLVSGYIGLGMVTFGLVLGVINAYWERKPRHIFGKIGWLSVVWGIALLGLALLHQKPINPASNPPVGGYMGMIVLGVVLVVVGEGGQAVIELPSLISHVLSYTRLIGILLSSVILADVINTVFLGTLGGGAASLVFGVIILVFGQGFNFILGLFEPGIQGARLLYVEFFSKFYRGNGRPFRPFGGRRVYTQNEVDIPETK
ncbi:MAG: V-type ATP synthase subunit I [Thermoprotei archaeon]